MADESNIKCIDIQTLSLPLDHKLPNKIKMSIATCLVVGEASKLNHAVVTIASKTKNLRPNAKSTLQSGDR